MTFSVAEARALMGTAAVGMPAVVAADLSGVLVAFEPVALKDMAEAALMDRFELKYVLPQRILPSILAEVAGSYCVLAIAGRRMSRYRSLYFDTPALALYMRHHAGAPDRYKIRSREYVDSREAFFEVKHRMPNRRTQKQRIETGGFLEAPGGAAAKFLTMTSPYSAGDMAAALWNAYTRITLVKKTRAERVTLDLNVEYAREDQSLALPEIVIVEVKYGGTVGGGASAAWSSPFVMALRRRGIRPNAFSKYCVGLSLLCAQIKHNRFKAEHLAIARTMEIERTAPLHRQMDGRPLARGGDNGHR